MEKTNVGNLNEQIFPNSETEINFMSYFDYGKMIELGS
jgi:hypothetical protein